MNHNIRHTDDHEFGRVYSVSSAAKPTLARKPRIHTRALSDCVCYDAEGNVIRTIARTTTTRNVTRKRRTTTKVSPAVRRDIMLQAAMGSIHDGDV